MFLWQWTLVRGNHFSSKVLQHLLRWLLSPACQEKYVWSTDIYFHNKDYPSVAIRPQRLLSTVKKVAELLKPCQVLSSGLTIFIWTGWGPQQCHKLVYFENTPPLENKLLRSLLTRHSLAPLSHPTTTCNMCFIRDLFGALQFYTTSQLCCPIK